MSFLEAGWLGHWLAGDTYTLIFIAMLIEGPVVTAAGAFAAALHVLNGYLVLALSVMGNVIPDFFFYALGFWGRERFVEKYGRYIGVTKEKIDRTEKIMKNHSGKSLMIIKLVPLIAAPGLITAGATKMDLKKYTGWCLLITIPSSLFYFLIGYYSGAAYHQVIHYLNIGIYVIAAALVILIAILYAQKNLAERILKRMEGE